MILTNISQIPQSEIRLVELTILKNFVKFVIAKSAWQI